MECEVRFSNISKSPFLSKYAASRVTSEIFEKYREFPKARLIFSREGKQIASRCCLYEENGGTFVVKSVQEDAYSAFDSALSKLIRLVEKSHRRRIEKTRYWAFRSFAPPEAVYS